jgi:hypothetical protein
MLQKEPLAQVLQLVQEPVWEELRQLLPIQEPHWAHSQPTTVIRRDDLIGVVI